MTPMEQPLHFPSNGKRLFGVVHEPVGERSKAGVVFLNAGPQNRVGPQRIYVNAARRFCDAGLTCLRVDLPGVGESEGPFPENNLDCHDPANVRGAIESLRTRGVESVVLLGLCVGARVAVRAALADPKVDAVVSWSAPVISGAADIIGEAISRAAARGHLRHWSRRLLQPHRWKRYLTSRQARSEGAAKLGGVLSTLLARSRAGGPPPFVSEMGTLLAGSRGVVIAYGERDIGPIAEFEDHFGKIVPQRGRDRCFLLVPGGDHTYASLAAQTRVISDTLEWLRDRYRLPETSRYRAS
jgi:pimeloyl-ACP methyl ester carboxylesterase